MLRRTTRFPILTLALGDGAWPGRRSLRFYVIGSLLAITACSTTPVPQCPAIVPYTPGQQAEAADEILALPAGSILEQMILDYGELRAKLRECVQ